MLEEGLDDATGDRAEHRIAPMTGHEPLPAVHDQDVRHVGRGDERDQVVASGFALVDHEVFACVAPGGACSLPEQEQEGEELVGHGISGVGGGLDECP